MLTEVRLPSAALQQKHPPAHPDTSIPPLVGALPNISVSEEIIHATRSLPNASVVELDGLRSQHLKDLKDMTNVTVAGDAHVFLSVLSHFATLVIQGKTPVSIRPLIFGASFMALSKKGGRIIANVVGCILCCLIAKTAGFRAWQLCWPLVS